MVERRRGGIVAISSAAGLPGVYGYSAYGPTNYAVRGLCDVLRTELKPYGIYVGCMFPTDVDTRQLAGEQPFLPNETRAISGTIKTDLGRQSSPGHPALSTNSEPTSSPIRRRWCWTARFEWPPVSPSDGRTPVSGPPNQADRPGAEARRSVRYSDP